jgi:hypothetical protein
MFIVTMAIAWTVGLGSTLALAFRAVKELYDLADEGNHRHRGQLGQPCTSEGHRERWGRRGRAARECVPRRAHARQATVARCHQTAARDSSRATSRPDDAHTMLSGRGAR